MTRFPLLFLLGCAANAATSPPPATDGGAAVAESCSYVVTGPISVGGGNPTCSMTVAVSASCAPGRAGHVFALFGEAPAPTLYAASVDAAYLCDVPVVLTRDGIACASAVAADVEWWTPSGVEGVCRG